MSSLDKIIGISKVLSNGIRQFNVKNVKTLIRAVKTESPLKILRNFRKLMANDTIGRVQVKEGLFFCCDYLSLYNRKLLIGGWCNSVNGVDQISFLIDGETIGNCSCEIIRPDVPLLYPDLKQTLHAGFLFELNWKNELPNIVEIQTTETNGQKSSFKVKPKNIKETLKLSPNIKLPAKEAYLLFLEQNAQAFARNQSKIQTKLKDWNSQHNLLVIFDGEISDLQLLKKQYKALENQGFEKWNWIVEINDSISQEQKNWLTSQSELDKRIQLLEISNNCGINELVKFASQTKEYDYLLLLDPRVVLAKNALFQLVNEVKENPDTNAAYGDNDILDENGQQCLPNFKGGFDYDLLLNHNYFEGLLFCEMKLLKNHGFLEDEIFNSYDLALQLAAKDFKPKHIAKILYHQTNNKKWTDGLLAEQKQVLQNHLVENKINGDVESGLLPNSFRVKRSIKNPNEISIIIPFKDDVETLQTCINSLFAKTEYPNFQLLLISNQSKEKETFDYLEKISQEYPNVQYLEFNEAFNYAEINNWAVKQCNSEWILFLNNDIEAINKGWLTAMAEQIQRPEVGAVGAKLLFPDNTIQHAGVIVGINGVADHAAKYFELKSPETRKWADRIQNFSACTAACLLTKKKLFEEVGGFDEINLKVNFNDVDFCLKLVEKKYKIIYTPYAQLYHYESKTRGSNLASPEKRKREEQEIMFFRKKWKSFVQKGDPFYNPNFSREQTDFSIDFRDL